MTIDMWFPINQHTTLFMQKRNERMAETKILEYHRKTMQINQENKILLLSNIQRSSKTQVYKYLVS